MQDAVITSAKAGDRQKGYKTWEDQFSCANQQLSVCRSVLVQLNGMHRTSLKAQRRTEKCGLAMFGPVSTADAGITGARFFGYGSHLPLACSHNSLRCDGADFVGRFSI